MSDTKTITLTENELKEMILPLLDVADATANTDPKLKADKEQVKRVAGDKAKTVRDKLDKLLSKPTTPDSPVQLYAKGLGPAPKYVGDKPNCPKLQKDKKP